MRSIHSIQKRIRDINQENEIIVGNKNKNSNLLCAMVLLFFFTRNPFQSFIASKTSNGYCSKVNLNE